MQDGLFLRVILRDGRFKEVLVLLIPINGDSGVSCLFFFFCESCNESLVHFLDDYSRSGKHLPEHHKW